MVSIIMGVYNAADTIKDAVESIIAQIYQDWEMIICDDCSSDESFCILKDYEEIDKRIRIIRNDKNMGLAASLNHCLEYVQGEYIARMDADDISLPDRLEKQVSYLEKNPEYAVVGTFMQEFSGNGFGSIIKNNLFPTKYELPKGAPFFHATIVVRTSVMKQLNGYHISNYTVRTEDVDLWYRFFANGYEGANINEPLYLVRTDDDAYKRRKLKYMLHASHIIWYGCDMVRLPFYYKIYCVKPILSWLFPVSWKKQLRKLLVK